MPIPTIKAKDTIRLPLPRRLDPLGQGARFLYAKVHAVCQPYIVTEDGVCFPITDVVVVTPQDRKDDEERGTLVSKITRGGGSVRDLADHIDLATLRKIAKSFEDRGRKAA